MNSSASPSINHYARLLRQHGAIVLVAMMVAGLVAYVLSKAQPPTYQAQSSLTFQDQSSELNVVGIPAAPASSADQLASLGAQTAVSATVLRRVSALFHPHFSLAALNSKVTATAQQGSDLVVVSAADRNPRVAASLADAVVNVTSELERAKARSVIDSAIRELERRVKALPSNSRNQVARADYQDELLHLQAAAAVANPAEISSYAPVPSSPASPKVARNTVIGVVLGLMVGLLIAFIRDARDSRIRDIDRIPQELDLPLLGCIRKDVLGSASPEATGENGPKATSADVEPFRVLLTNFQFLTDGPDPKRILVTSAMPAEGKSTVAAWLALASASVGHRTLLVECDLRKPVLADRLQLAKTPGLIDYLRGGAIPQQILQPLSRNYSTNGDGGDLSTLGGMAASSLVCIAAGDPSIEPAALLESERFGEFLQEVGDVYDRVIVDSSPLLPVADTLTLVTRVDGLVLCVRQDQTTAGQARRAIELVAHAGSIRKAVVATGVSRREQYDYYGYYAYARDPTGGRS